MKNRFPLLSEWLLLILISQLHFLTCALTKCSLRFKKQVYASMKCLSLHLNVFSLSGEYGYPVVKRTLPACPLSTSCVIHPYCYTDVLTRPSLPLLTRPSTVWLYLSAQRSVLSPLPIANNRHHRTQTPSRTDLSISAMFLSSKCKLVIQAYETL